MTPDEFVDRIFKRGALSRPWSGGTSTRQRPQYSFRSATPDVQPKKVLPAAQTNPGYGDLGGITFGKSSQERLVSTPGGAMGVPDNPLAQGPADSLGAARWSGGDLRFGGGSPLVRLGTQSPSSVQDFLAGRENFAGAAPGAPRPAAARPSPSGLTQGIGMVGRSLGSALRPSSQPTAVGRQVARQ